MTTPIKRNGRTVRRTTRNRDAFTLLEMMLAVTIMLMVFAMTVPMFRSQIRAMSNHAGRFDAQQNVQFALSTIDRELRVAGAGLPDKQPMIVQATSSAVTFNVDLATRDTTREGGAWGAVYTDNDLPVGATMSLLPADAISLPLSTIRYPDSTYYRSAGLSSSAETISFWVAPDNSAGSNGRYALFRRVNALPPDTIARGLIVDPATPTFAYTMLDTTGTLVPVPTSSLPIYHSAIHGGVADTGGSAMTDAIRSVKLHLVGSSIERDGSITKRMADATIRLLNAGLLLHSTCGDEPVFGQTVTATYVATPGPHVIVSWLPALDESGGEKDVERYAVYRRPVTSSVFGEPLASIPAGLSTYPFDDSQVVAGDWVYAVAAQDCGGQFSEVKVSNQVTVPIP